MDDPTDWPVSPLWVRLVWLALVWASVGLLFGTPVLFELLNYASYRSAYEGTCGLQAMYAPPYPCSWEQCLDEYGDGYSRAGVTVVQVAWVGLLSGPVLLFWAVALVIVIAFQLRDSPPAWLRSEIGPWTVGFLLQSSLNAAALAALVWKSQPGPDSWHLRGDLSVLVVAVIQLLWFVPLLTVKGVLWPRGVPGLVAGAMLSALAGLAVVIAECVVPVFGP